MLRYHALVEALCMGDDTQVITCACVTSTGAKCLNAERESENEVLSLNCRFSKYLLIMGPKIGSY